LRLEGGERAHRVSLHHAPLASAAGAATSSTE
jgi:hypothetical protein